MNPVTIPGVKHLTSQTVQPRLDGDGGVCGNAFTVKPTPQHTPTPPPPRPPFQMEMEKSREGVGAGGGGVVQGGEGHSEPKGH